MRPSQSTRDQKASRVKRELVGEVVLVYSKGGWGGCIGKTTSHLRRDPAQWEKVRCHLNSVISSA